MRVYVNVLPLCGDRVGLHYKTTGPRDACGFNGFGGKVEPDEDIKAAARRELREELGVWPPGEFVSLDVQRGPGFRVHWFAVKVDACTYGGELGGRTVWVTVTRHGVFGLDLAVNVAHMLEDVVERGLLVATETFLPQSV